MTQELKRTPLYEKHVALGAKMVPFAGFEMPLQYTSIKEEHLAVRACAGLFDVSHMGEAEFRGKDAAKALDRLMTQDISKLKVDRAVYTTMCHENGGIVDDLIVYRLAEEHFLVCLNASNREKDIAHMKKYLIEGDVKLTDTSDQWGQVALQGPKAEAILAKISDKDVTQIKRFGVLGGVVRTGEGNALCLIARTGYTGEDGFEIYVPKKQTTALFDALMVAGKEEGLVPAGLGCRDTLRLEAQYMLYGNDLSDEVNPLEAGLGWVTKLKKESDFVGKDALIATKKAGLERKLVAFELEGKGVIRHDYKLQYNGQEVGFVTSGGFSPTLEKSIGLGFVATNALKEIEENEGGLSVLIRQKEVPVRIVKSFLSEKV